MSRLGIVEPFPLNFDGLEKGVWVEGHELEKALGCTVESGDKWRLAMLKLKEMIEDRTGLLCCEDHNRIRIMTDEEGAEHTRRLHRQKLAGMVKQLGRRARVDPSDFDSMGRSRFESESRMMAAVTHAALRADQKQRKLEALQRHQIEANAKQEQAS